MKPIEITDGNFQTEVMDSSIPVLLDFTAVWCGPCKALAPTIDEIAGEFEGKLKVGKVDVDANQITANNFGVRSIPTLLIFKDGKVVESLIGLVKKSVLVEKIELHLN